MTTGRQFLLLVLSLFLICSANYVQAYDLVDSHQKISYIFGGFAPADTLDDLDYFGTSIVEVGDLDGDGVIDLAVSAPGDDDGGNDCGAVWILFMTSDERVKARQKISELEGNFSATLDDGDNFGISMAALGDHDGDGLGDIVVGTSSDDDGGPARGAVRIIFLNADGTVKAHQKISDLYGGFTGLLDDGDNFGRAVASLGDLDDDGVGDIAVGAYKDDDGGSDRGAVWILFLNIDGTVKSYQKISDTEGGFTGTIDDYDNFSRALSSVGTLDADTIPDLVVGANFDDDGGLNRGAVYILFLNGDGTVKGHQKISDTEGGFTGELGDEDFFGRAVAGLGDLDNDAIEDVAVGAYFDNDGGSNRGAVWILFLNIDGTVKSHQKISDTEGGFTGDLDNDDYFGNAIALLGDKNEDTVQDIAVGAYWDDDGGLNKGACWQLYLNSNGTVAGHAKISDTAGRIDDLNDGDCFGWSLAAIGDLDNDGVDDAAAAAAWDDNDGTALGALYILFMNSNGTVKSRQKISTLLGNFSGAYGNSYFGWSITGIGDLDGDTVEDIAVGATGDDDGGTDRGAVWILFLYPDGTVKAHQKISDTAGNFTGTLNDGDRFGSATAMIGDLDGDTVQDLAVGADLSDGVGVNRGAVWILFMNTNGTVKSHQKISDTEGGFTGTLDNEDWFGTSVAALGDFDGDTLEDIVVGANGDDDGGAERGAAWVLFLNPNGTVKAHQKISDTEGGFAGTLFDEDLFGKSVALIEDLNGDGVDEIAVGASRNDGSAIDMGGVWVLIMNVNGTVQDYQLIDNLQGNFLGILDTYDYFGFSLASMGDLNLDGHPDVMVGAYGDDDGGSNRGAAWTLFLGNLLSCTVSPPVVEFGQVALGEYQDENFVIKNTGLETLTGSISEPCTDFAILSGAGAFALATDESLIVSIRFEPTRIGSLSCSIATGSSVCSEVTCTGIVASAFIDSVVDVPGDEGGWVRLFFSRSVYDIVGELQYPISFYDINRRVDNLSLQEAIASEGKEVGGDPSAQLSGQESPLQQLRQLADGARCVIYDDRLFKILPDAYGTAPPGIWEVVGNVSARQDDNYIFLAPSIADSAETIPYSVFYISAHTTIPSIYFDSPADSGYSVDNTILCTPTGFTVDYNTGFGNYLSWDECTNANFHYYAIYRGDDPGFVPIPSNLVHTTIQTNWNDPEYDGYDVHYKITSVTIDDKESPPASPVTVTAVNDTGVPERFALYQNVPNPFNPVTTIQYDVPADGGMVRLHVYDVTGRLVRTLVHEEQAPGTKRIIWNGRDDNDQEVSSGIYFYRLHAPGFTRTLKMVLLQ